MYDNSHGVSSKVRWRLTPPGNVYSALISKPRRRLLDRILKGALLASGVRRRAKRTVGAAASVK